MDAPQRDLFIWRKEHEKCLVVELLSHEPYMHRPNSKERGQAWKDIADKLNELETPSFRVTARAVRNKFRRLLEAFKRNEAVEKRASGIEGTEYDEVYQALTDISSRIEEATAAWAEIGTADAEKKRKEKEQAEDMRLKATERIGETLRRHESETADVTPRRKRKAGGGSDMYQLVEEGVRLRRETREQELQLKEREIEERKATREMFRDMMEGQQRLFSQMQEQHHAMLINIQEQNAQIINLMTKCLLALGTKNGN